MSKRYPGGIITKSPATPTGPYDTGAAPGIWTLDQQLQYQQQGIWPIAGNSPPYIEDVFSTWLYTGTGATQTITNGIDLSTKGGMVWMKNRTTAYNNAIVDSARGLTNGNILYTNLTSAAQTGYPENTAGISAFNTTGFTLRSDANGVGTNYAPGENLVSWTFRKQPKFFDVVTYTGDGTNPRNISHNLGSVPGCIIAKRTSTTGPWAVYHRGVSPINNNTLALQSTAAASDGGQDLWGNGATVVVPTSTVFTVSNSLNTNGVTYVAYLFAHDAGGFGLTGTDNVISCGSFTTDSGGNATVNLGYEPAWLMFKCTSNAGQNWEMIDTMRGWSMSTDVAVQANSSAAEASGGYGNPTSTGFVMGGQGNTQTYIYIAIRRGPMKVPTLGTSVFAVDADSASSKIPTWDSNFPVDMAFAFDTQGGGGGQINSARLLGSKYLLTPTTDAEASNGSLVWDSNLGWGKDYDVNRVYYSWMFRRAPGFFDEVCYTGGSPYNRAHNLTVVPELMIVKCRDTAYNWAVYSSALGNTKYLRLSSTIAAQTDTDIWSSTTPTATTFYGGPQSDTSGGGALYVAYLFATCAGVSKVGSYTGNGTTQTINCGFTGGARFVLIKRTDSTGDWYVWDSARGIVAGNDPHLSLNTTAAEVTTDDSVDTDSTGFVVNQLSATNINVTSATYIFLSVA